MLAADRVSVPVKDGANQRIIGNVLKARRIRLWVLLSLPVVILPLLGISAHLRLPARARTQIREALAIARRENEFFHLQTAALLAPGQAHRWETAGYLARERGEDEIAVEYFQVAEALDGLSAEGRLALGEAYLESGRISEAQSALREALEAGESPRALYERLAETQLASGDYPAAVDTLQTLSGLYPADLSLRFRLGKLLAVFAPDAALAHLTQVSDGEAAHTGSAEEIALALRRGRSAGDRPAYTQVLVGRVLGAQGDWGLAAEAFERATRLNPEYAEAWAYLGEAHQQLGEDGYLALSEGYRLDPESVVVRLLLSFYWQRQGNPEWAMEHLRAVERMEPENPTLQAEIGDTLADLGEVEAALEAYRRAVALAPEDPQYWRLLAAFSVGSELQVREVGLPAARQAVLLDERDPRSLDLLGQAYALVGDPLSAVRFYRQALEADPEFVGAHFHLGLLQLAQGERAAGRRHLETVVSLAEGTETAENARRVLQYYFP